MVEKEVSIVEAELTEGRANLEREVQKAKEDLAAFRETLASATVARLLS
jgi:hypothetical protein